MLYLRLLATLACLCLLSGPIVADDLPVDENGVIQYCATSTPSDEELAGVQADLQPHIEAIEALRSSTVEGNLRGTSPSLTTHNTTRTYAVGDRQFFLPQSTVILVYVHILTSSSGEGRVSNTPILNQIRVLNDDYRAAGFGFSLRSKYEGFEVIGYKGLKLIYCSVVD